MFKIFYEFNFENYGKMLAENELVEPTTEVYKNVWTDLETNPNRIGQLARELAKANPDTVNRIGYYKGCDNHDSAVLTLINEYHVIETIFDFIPHKTENRRPDIELSKEMGRLFLPH